MKKRFTQFLKDLAPSKRKTESTSTKEVELGDFFTDVEHLRTAFAEIVSAATLTKRLLVIHGVGGVGKSSLLRMFRLHCKTVDIPVALASGDETKSAFDILARWAYDLKTDGITLSEFGKTFEHYREIQAKVEAQAQKAGGRPADIASKAASKAAEAAGGALAGAAIGSVIPGIGTTIGGALGGVLGGMGADALTDWLRGFLKQPDIDLLLDPAKKLTGDFVEDMKKAAQRRRIVLMLDTFEQMSALEDWVCKVAQQIKLANVLLVIAGRAIPNWSRTWDSWMANGQIEELKPMTEEVMHVLIARYYATMRGGEPDPVQVEAIIRFARGLPMVVTSGVQLWVKYGHGFEDFQSIKPEIVANLVDRLMEGVPSDLIPALEAAASVRWFDQPILRAVTGLTDVREAYNELRRFPFVRVRTEGLALHDAVREIIEENLRMQDSERHSELHMRAAAYFEKRLENAAVSSPATTAEEAERLGLERLYHRIRADEGAGIKLFQEMAEELARFYMLSRLEKLLNDINTYPLNHENSRMWHEYYVARLAQLQWDQTQAEKVYQIFQAISENEQAEPKLRAYALCDWGTLLGDANRQFATPQSADQAIQIIKRSLATVPSLDAKTVQNFRTLRAIYERQNAWPEARAAIDQLLEFHRQRGDTLGQAENYSTLRWHHYLVGDFRQMLTAHETATKLAAAFVSRPFIKMKTLRTTIGWIEMGRYAEVEHNHRESLKLLSALNTAEFESEFEVNLALALGVQRKFQEAHQRFEKALAIRSKAKDEFFIGYWESFWARIFLMQGEGGLSQAESHLKNSLELKDILKNEIVGTLNMLGMWHELRKEWTQAEDYYRQSLQYNTGRHYLEACALAGLSRVKYALGQLGSIGMPAAEIVNLENLAQGYEYNDHLASLNLIKGHLAWKDPDSSRESRFASALHFYQQALIYALRYNRFLLDEVLWGGGITTPLPSLLPFCEQQGQEGQRMLSALHNWWKTGNNSTDVTRPETVSLIPENIPLLQAEELARQREPGDNSPQQKVVEWIKQITGQND